MAIRRFLARPSAVLLSATGWLAVPDGGHSGGINAGFFDEIANG